MHRIKPVRIILLLGLLVMWAVPACSEGLAAKNLPVEGRALTDFLPKGWTVETQARGDLNGDGVADLAAVLVQDDQVQGDDQPERAMIVILSYGKAKFTLAGTNDTIFQCKGCGGVKEGVGISIKKGVIIATQSSGSREFASETWRFRYDSPKRRFIIIGNDLETWDGLEGAGTNESSNYLTGQKITENYLYDENGDQKIVCSSKKEKIPRKTPFMEDVKASY